MIYTIMLTHYWSGWFSELHPIKRHRCYDMPTVLKFNWLQPEDGTKQLSIILSA